MLFKNYLVLLMSFLPSIALAVKDGASSSSQASASSSHPHPYASQQPNSQDESSSSFVSRLLRMRTQDRSGALSVFMRSPGSWSQGIAASGQVVSYRMSLPPLAPPLPPLARPLPPRELPLLIHPLPIQEHPLPTQEHPLPPQELPHWGEFPSQPLPPPPAVRSCPEAQPSLSVPRISPDSFDFSNPELDGDTVKEKLQELRDALSNPQRPSVKLHLHMKHFFEVQHIFSQFHDPSSLPSIHLELHQFIKSGEFKFIELYKFLENISPTLTRLFFIDCDISLKPVKDHYMGKADRKIFLQNITELEFRGTKLSVQSFMILAQLIAKLKKLERITLHLERPLGQKSDPSINIQNDLLGSMRSIFKKNSETIKKLTLGGSFFDELMINIFMYIMSDFSLVHVNLKELDISKMPLSSDQVISVLKEFDENFRRVKILGKLKKLHIPNISSDPRFKELQEPLVEQRGGRGLQIVFGHP